MISTAPTPLLREETANPFPGLVSFNEGDPIFERDSDVDLIQGSLWAGQCVVLFAASGVGKSSFIKAKLVPTLKSVFGLDSIYFRDSWSKQASSLIDRVSEDIKQKALAHLAESSDAEDIKARCIETVSECADTEGTKIRAALPEIDAEVVKAEVFRYISNHIEGKETKETNRVLFAQIDDLESRDIAAAAIKSIADRITTYASKPTWLVILDQFEEIFQRYPDSRALQPFGESIRRLTSASPLCEVRLLIGIREEFIAQLSHLENYVPGIFSNYYRLSKPTRQQVQSIIVQTADLRGVKVSQNVNLLLDDLSALHITTQQQSAEIDLPYLQVVCHRIWEREKPSVDTEFLRTYKKGQTAEELDAHCRGPLNAMSRGRRMLVSKALGYLTGPHEAKRSVSLSELAADVGARNASRLGESLSTLSVEKVKILRRVEKDKDDKPATVPVGDGEDLVFSLYHDMYAPMLWRWRQEQEKSAQIRRIVWTAVICSLLWIIVINPALAWWKVRIPLSRAEGTPDDIKDLLDFRNTLSHTLIWKPVADQLWSTYTQRFMTLSALRADTDGAILFKLAGAAAEPGDLPRPPAGTILGPAEYLGGTHRTSTHTGIVDAVLLPSGETFAGTSDGRIVWWSDDGVEHSVNPESEESPGYSDIGLQRVLCFSPAGDYAVFAWLEREDKPKKGQIPKTQMRIAAVDARTGKVLPNTDGFTVGIKVDNYGPDSVQSAIAYAKAVLSANGDQLALLVDGHPYVLDKSFKTLIANPELPGWVDGLSFVPGGNDLALLVTGGPYSQDPNGQIFFWDLQSQKLLSNPYGVKLQSIRYPRNAALVFENDKLLVPAFNLPWIAQPTVPATTDNWKWIGADGSEGQSIVLPSKSNPQVLDPTRRVLISEDGYGRLVLTDLSVTPSRSTILSISESRSDPRSPEQRRITPASASRLVDKGELLSIDGIDRSTVRRWAIPDRSAWTPVAPPLGASNVLRPSCPGYRSADGKWCASVASNNTLTLVNEDKETTPRSLGQLPESRSMLSNIIISADGKRVLVFYSDVILLLMPDSQQKRLSIPRGEIVDAVFGPGPDRVTFLSDSTLSIYDRKAWTDSRRVWSKPCIGANLVHDGDEGTVVVYSRAWIHWLTFGDAQSPAGGQGHQWLPSWLSSGRSDSEETPSIVSALSPVPISFDGLRPTKVNGKDDNRELLLTGTNLRPRYSDSVLPSARGWTSWTLELCVSSDLWYESPTHQMLCKWALRSGRQFGRPPTSAPQRER